MRLMKKALAISLVTALTFTSFELPVRATEYTNVQTEQESTTQTKVNEDETVVSKDSVTQDQEAVEGATDEGTKPEDENATDITDETKKDVTDESNTTDSSSSDNSVKEETESKEEISEIQQLINKALLDNGTITLSEDLQVKEMIDLILPKDMEQTSITLELNGYKINSDTATALLHIGEGVTLTIKGEGSIINEKDNGIVIYNEGTIKLDHADLLATGSKSLGVLNNSTLGEKGLIIKSGTIKAEWFAIGRTAKAEVSINRPTAFFAAAGIVMPSETDEIEQGSYSVDENASVVEDSTNRIEVSVSESQDDSTKEEDNKETTTDQTSTDKTTDVTKQEEVAPTANTSTDSSPQTSQPTTTEPQKQNTVVAPEIPANVNVSVNKYNSITITWSTASGAKGYIVERIQTDTNKVTELTKTTANSYNDTNNIIVGKEYRYRVYAYTYDDLGAIQKSAASAEVAIKTTIGNPQNLAATQSSSTSVKLTWSGVEGAASYKVYRAAKDGAFKLVETTSSTSYKDSSLKTGTKYTYKVTAVSGDYESADSNKVKLYAAAAGVKKLKASSSAYNKIDLSWKKASGATKYVVYRSTKEGSGYKKVKTVTSNKYTDTVKTGVTYYYQIVSYTNKARGGESAVISGVALAAAPTKVKATNNAYNSTKISWEKSKGAGSYAIYRSTSKKSGYTLIKTVSKSKTSYTDKSVEAGNTYYYKVCAVNKGQEGKMSKVVSSKIKPSAVKDLKAKSAGGKNITITWSASKGASSYEIYRSTSAKSGYSQVGTTTSLSFNNNKLKDGTTYYYRVYAIAGKIKSDYKQVSYVNPGKVYMSSSTLSMESGETEKLTVSFNPSSVSDGTVTWASANKKIATVSAKGIITALSAGVTTVTATTINGLTATCEVSVDQEESGVVVVLDPGHGGSDPGKTYGSLKEKDLNLKISTYTKAELDKYSGIIVKMTRTDDTYLDLDERTAIAKKYGADMFISQHNNSAVSSASGAEVFVSLDGRFNSQSTKLGAQILNRLTGLGLNNRGVKTRRGENGDYYAVIRTSVSRGFPGIIVESAFLTNAEDREILSTEAGLKSIGVATATAIAEYYNLTKK